jgi:hypothetical protein
LGDKDSKTPFVPGADYAVNIRKAAVELEDSVKDGLVKWAFDMRAKLLFPDSKSDHV